MSKLKLQPRKQVCDRRTQSSRAQAVHGDAIARLPAAWMHPLYKGLR